MQPGSMFDTGNGPVNPGVTHVHYKWQAAPAGQMGRNQPGGIGRNGGVDHVVLVLPQFPSSSPAGRQKPVNLVVRQNEASASVHAKLSQSLHQKRGHGRTPGKNTPGARSTVSRV